MNKLKIGLVLSGDGITGVSQIGVLKALEELDIKPDFISGVSSGAVIGAFYAAGYSIEKITEIFTSNSVFNYLNKPRNYIDFLKANEKMYRSCFKKKFFKDVQIPLYISARDYSNGNAVVYSQGDIVDAIIASTVHTTIRFPNHGNGKKKFENVGFDVFPIEPLITQCEILIGAFINPIKKMRIASGMINVIDKKFSTNKYKELQINKSKCDVIIEPPLFIEDHALNTEDVFNLIEIGYKYTRGMNGRINIIKQIKSPKPF